MSRPSRARLCPDCSGSGSRLNDRGVPVLCRCMYAAAGSPARMQVGRVVLSTPVAAGALIEFNPVKNRLVVFDRDYVVQAHAQPFLVDVDGCDACEVPDTLRECMYAEERRDDALWRGFCAGLLAASIVWAAVVVWLGPWWAA